MVVFRSNFPDVTVDERTLPEFLLDCDMPDRPYITDALTGKSHTFASLRSQAMRFGAGLVDNLGWKKKDVMCIFSMNVIDYPIVLLGTLLAAGTVTPANPSYTTSELVHQLKDSGARACVVHPDLLTTALAAAEQVGIPKSSVFCFGGQAKGDSSPWQKILSQREIGFSFARQQIDNKKDLAYLVYSSGTTGLAKGVMLSHRNIVSNIQVNHGFDGKELVAGKDVMVGLLPFYHIFGLTCIMQQCLKLQIQLVVHQAFDLERFLQSVQKYRITFCHLVPPIILRLAKDPLVQKYDISSLRMINSGAAPLSASLAQEAVEKTKVPIKQGYGLTETSPTSNSQTWAGWKTSIGSVGGLGANFLAKIVADDERELGPGEDGEIWFKGPSIMQGYLNNPTATKNALTSDGYFKTGDVGHFDKENNLYITDRLKELIKFKGFQVAPAELEGLLLTHPAIVDVGVVGYHDEAQATELPRAYVVLREGTKESRELQNEIAEFVKSKLAKHKQLRGGVIFLDAIPKSPSGKILRRLLRDRKDPLEVKAKL